MQETRIQYLGQEDLLEKEMATHSSTAWRIPWTEEPGGLWSMVSQRVRYDWVTNTFTLSLSKVTSSNILSDVAAVSTVIKEGSMDGRGRPAALEMLNSFISGWDELSS